MVIVRIEEEDFDWRKHGLKDEMRRAVCINMYILLERWTFGFESSVQTNQLLDYFCEVQILD